MERIPIGNSFNTNPENIRWRKKQLRGAAYEEQMLRVLDRLQGAPVGVAHIEAAMGYRGPSGGTVTKYLKRLEEKGLIRSRKRGGRQRKTYVVLKDLETPDTPQEVQNEPEVQEVAPQPKETSKDSLECSVGKESPDLIKALSSLGSLPSNVHVTLSIEVNNDGKQQILYSGVGESTQ